MINLLELVKFDGYQIFWSIFIIPFFTIDSIIQFRRGWRILKGEEVSLFWVVKFRIWLIKMYVGRKQAEEYHARNYKYYTQSKRFAMSAIFYGVLGIFSMITLTIVLIYSLMN